MARIIPPSLKRHVFPHPEGKARASLLRKKALSAYFLFFAILFFTFTFLDRNFPGVLGFATDINSSDIVSLTNKEREDRGISALETNSLLKEAAEAKARDMFAKDYWAHTAPDGEEPWDFIDGVGYVYLSAGENLAKDFDHSSSVVKAWLESSSHRDNLLNPHFEEIGIAVVDGELSGFETTLVVQMFGTPQASYLASIGAEAEQVESSGEEIAGSSEEGENRTFDEVAESGFEEGPTPVVSSPRSTQMALTDSGYRPLVQTEVFARMPGITKFENLSLRHFGLSVGLLCATFLVGLFVLDVTIVSRRRSVRVTLHTLAHLALLIFLLIGVWYSQVGVIL